jgi:hypothetical protein
MVVLRQFFAKTGKLSLRERFLARIQPGKLPVPMIAMVSTAVCLPCIIDCPHTNRDLKIQATLAEWQSGVWVSVDFAANRYESVYKNHVRTLEALKTARPKGYKKMMTTLYNSSRLVI